MQLFAFIHFVLPRIAFHDSFPFILLVQECVGPIEDKAFIIGSTKQARYELPEDATNPF